MPNLLKVSVIRSALYRESKYPQLHEYHLLKHALSSFIFHWILSKFQYLKHSDYSTCWNIKQFLAIFLSSFILLKCLLFIQFMLFSDRIFYFFGENLPFFRDVFLCNRKGYTIYKLDHAPCLKNWYLLYNLKKLINLTLARGFCCYLVSKCHLLSKYPHTRRVLAWSRRFKPRKIISKVSILLLNINLFIYLYLFAIDFNSFESKL